MFGRIIIWMNASCRRNILINPSIHLIPPRVTQECSTHYHYKGYRTIKVLATPIEKHLHAGSVFSIGGTFAYQ